MPDIQHDFNFQFIGLIGLADPVRESVIPALLECYNAGVKVKMITGDYSGTAQKIARYIGLREAEHVITGPELMEMSEEELAREKLEM